MYQVYGIRCKENGRIYIGCTRRPLQDRLADHFFELKRNGKTFCKETGKRDLSNWQKDYNQYGKDGFDFYLIEDNIPDDDHMEREAYWIREYKSHEEQYGYNLRVRDKVKQFTYTVALPPKPFE